MAMQLPFAESYRIIRVEQLRNSKRDEREKWLKDAEYNMFNLKTDQVFIDLLTDSGNGAMSDKQRSAIMLGGESNSGASSYHNLKKAAKEILGFPYILPTHQGRGAENVLFSTMVKTGDIVPGNSLHDIMQSLNDFTDFRNATSIDCSMEGGFNPIQTLSFKGNVDLDKLEEVLSKNRRDQVPMIIVSVTCNASGGQPVSLDNLKSVRKLADKYGIPVCFDSARFAENAYFIKSRENGYKDTPIKKIVLEMFSYADMTFMSFKNDCMINIGGLLAFRDEITWRKAVKYNTLFEGSWSDNGLAGRGFNVLAKGLYEAVELEFLETRIMQVQYLANKLEKYGIPFMKPVGGHAILLDAGTLLGNLQTEMLPSHVLGCELYLEAGIRGLQLGTKFWRLSIPRKAYTNNHMDVVAVALKNIYDRRHEIKNVFKATRAGARQCPVL